MQEKVPLFNYLPIVSLRAWLERDGKELLCGRAEKDVMNSFSNCLKACGFSDSILETRPLDEIAATLFPENTADKKLISGRRQFLDYLAKHSVVKVACASGPSVKAMRDLGDQFPGLRRALLKELVTQKLTGYYFLRFISPDLRDSGYVIIMREIRHLPKAIADLVAAGAVIEEIEAANIEPYEHQSCLDFGTEDFAYPIGQIDSPYVEHVMQNFSMLFARIGLPDFDAGLYEGLWQSATKRESTE